VGLKNYFRTNGRRRGRKMKIDFKGQTSTIRKREFEERNSKNEIRKTKRKAILDGSGRVTKGLRL
jgi:hypothetical protein